MRRCGNRVTRAWAKNPGGSSSDVVAMPGGIAFLNRDHPAAHDMNRIVVTDPRSPALLANAAAARSDHRAPNHRLLDVYEAELGDRAAGALAKPGHEPGKDPSGSQLP